MSTVFRFMSSTRREQRRDLRADHEGAAVDHSWSYDQEDRHELGRPVVVWGMHRSGTSVVARIINLLGLPLCRDDDLHSGPDNPTGHWESESLVKFNDRLLKMFGGSWVFPAAMSRNWESAPSVAAFRGEGVRVFRNAYPNEEWVWKDPRACLTLPFWRTVWQDAPVVVLVSREPLEIYLSLRKRDGLGKAHCIALWERYARSALFGAHGLPMITISYDQLMKDSLGAVSNLRDDLVGLGVMAHGNVDAAAQCVSTEFGGSREYSYRLQADPDSTETQRLLIEFIESLPRTSPEFIVTDLGCESSSTTELLCAVRCYPPRLSLVAGEVWRAFRRSAAARGLVP
jgi:hypothetical protein